MDAIEAIMSRRSIRRYTDKRIPEDKITTLLKAAMN
ncbi:nitroreductase family protein, partial [Candidatus Bathyarchaeota archaeon]|nr:nitroreductase family protein [Candidatus Bathyarchaeota archaeon]